jgi:hypothetical protein
VQKKFAVEVCGKWSDLSMLEGKQTVQVLLYSCKALDVLVLISGDIRKNIQVTRAALVKCGNP